jgi:Ribbon-helix-helix protein, copG family
METRKETKSQGEKRMTRSNDKIVRFNLYLPKEAYEALERLQQLSGKRSLAETVRAALKLYHVVQEGIGEGKEIMLVDK